MALFSHNHWSLNNSTTSNKNAMIIPGLEWGQKYLPGGIKSVQNHEKLIPADLSATPRIATSISWIATQPLDLLLWSNMIWKRLKNTYKMVPWSSDLVKIWARSLFLAGTDKAIASYLEWFGQQFKWYLKWLIFLHFTIKKYQVQKFLTAGFPRIFWE